MMYISCKYTVKLAYQSVDLDGGEGVLSKLVMCVCLCVFPSPRKSSFG